MAKTSGQGEESNGERSAFRQGAKRQMDVDTYPDKVIGQTVNDAARPAFPIREACELAIGVVESVGTDVQHHASDIRAQIAIVVEMPGDNSNDAAEEAYCCRRHPQLFEEGRQAKTDLPVKMDVDPTFELARFVGCFDCGRGGARREINRHF